MDTTALRMKECSKILNNEQGISNNEQGMMNVEVEGF
jgi:hypothetical protein